MVKSDMTAEQRLVKVGPSVEQISVVEKGLKPGEIVVTDGQLRLVHGSKVDVKDGDTQGAKRP